MVTKKMVRYTRGGNCYDAAANMGSLDCWGNLDGMRNSSCHPTKGDEYRVTVERIEPEPENKWWWCSWNEGQPLSAAHSWGDNNKTTTGWRNNKVIYAAAAVHSTTEPTLAEFAAAVKDATGVEIPMPEEEKPQWWTWDTSGPDGPGYWRAASTCTVPQTTKYFTTVYGTTADRDAKRDALLEAARKAGKPD